MNLQRCFLWSAEIQMIFIDHNHRCILDERYPESQIKVYLRNVIKVFGYNKNISDITKELVYGGVGVEKIGYEGEDLEEYYTNLLSEVKSNETA